MKQIAKLFFGFIFFVVMFSGCEDLLGDDCAECCLVTYDADWNEISRENCIEYCGEELEAIENEPPVTIGGYTKQYECN